MRINKLDNIFQLYNKNSGVNKVKSESGTKASDEIKISEKALEFQFAMEKVKNVEIMRKDKVDKIKQQVQSGTYEVDGNKIADKIFESINFDKKI